MTILNTLTTLTRASLPSLTLLAGDDVGLYAEMKQALLSAIGYDSKDLTYSYFDMAESDMNDVLLDVESLPFFADDKVVIMDNLQDLTTDKKSYLDEQATKALEGYLTNPSETTRLIILAAGKLDGKRRLVKLLKREALVLDASPLSDDEVSHYFRQKAAAEGLVFEPQAFEDLLVKSQYDFSTISKNLAFMGIYKGKGSAISQDDIREALPKSLQDNIFDLTKLVLSGKMTEAMALVLDLRLQGEDEIKLIAIMLGQLRLYLQVRLLSGRGRSDQQVVIELSDYLGRQVNAHQVRFALRDSRALSVRFLKRAIVELIRTDFQIKTGTYDKAYLFELALLKLANGG